MRTPRTCTLETALVRLEPLAADHAVDLEAAARDGELWNLRVTSVPAPGETTGLCGRGAEGPRRRAHAAVRGARPAQRKGHRQHALSRHRARRRTPGDRLHLVRQELAAQPREHHLQAAAARRTRSRRWAPSWWVAHRQLQLRQPARHRAAGRAQGWRTAPPRPAARRHGARHRHVQPGCGRMARGQGAPAIRTRQAKRSLGSC